MFEFHRVKCIGFARRRRGRGGRIVLDRISTNMDEFWANLDYTIYSGGTKLTAKEICRQNELKKMQQQESLVRDKSQSIVIDLEPSDLPQTSSVSEQRGITASDDKMDNIVIKSEEKTALTVNEHLDAVNRTKSDIANAIVGKHFDLKRNDVNITTTTTTFDAITNRNNGTVNIINTDNNNNSGNNSSSSSKNNSNNSSSSNANSRLSNINNTFRLPSNTSGNVRRRLSLAPSSSSSLSFAENPVDASDTTSPLFHQSDTCSSSKAYVSKAPVSNQCDSICAFLFRLFQCLFSVSVLQITYRKVRKICPRYYKRMKIIRSQINCIQIFSVTGYIFDQKHQTMIWMYTATLVKISHNL